MAQAFHTEEGISMRKRLEEAVDKDREDVAKQAEVADALKR